MDSWNGKVIEKWKQKRNTINEEIKLRVQELNKAQRKAREAHAWMEDAIGLIGQIQAEKGGTITGLDSQNIDWVTADGKDERTQIKKTT